MVTTWYGDDSPHLSLPNSQLLSPAARGRAPGQQARLVKTVNVQVGGSSPWTRPSAPGCGDTSKALASYGSIYRGTWATRLRGRYRLGPPTVVLLFMKRRDGSMYSQAYVGAGDGLTLPGSSVAFRDRG